MNADQKQDNELVRAALAVRRQAYARYSGFHVGAALRTDSGKIFHGCNVENASYGLAICAERNAITTMVAEGERCIVAMAVVTKGAGSPCGACRQVMSEFGDNFPIYLVDSETEQISRIRTMDELLPEAFKSFQRDN
jgi:cytidine deaminase